MRCCDVVTNQRVVKPRPSGRGKVLGIRLTCRGDIEDQAWYEPQITFVANGNYSGRKYCTLGCFQLTICF